MSDPKGRLLDFLYDKIQYMGIMIFSEKYDERRWAFRASYLKMILRRKTSMKQIASGRKIPG